jgi:mono/diheme cytochrome c family protein
VFSRLFFVLVISFVATLAFAQEDTLQLKPGVGQEKVLAYCSACHSVDYIQMNSPFPERKLWEAQVTKMINAFGAPIPKEDITTIVDYLTAQYGKP